MAQMLLKIMYKKEKGEGNVIDLRLKEMTFYDF